MKAQYKIGMFDANVTRMLAQEIEKALAPLATKYDIGIRTGRGRYEDAACTLALECTVRVNGKLKSKIELDFDNYYAMFGLKKKDFGRLVDYLGVKYKIIGLRPGASRFPLIVERQPDGRKFRLPLEVIRKNATI